MAVQDLGIAILLVVCVVTSASADQVGRSTSQSACLHECGGIDVPYPFGLFGDSAECFLNKEFRLTCNDSFTPPRLLYAGDTPVLNTSLEEGTMIFEYSVAFTRYNVSGVEHAYATAVSLGEISPFTFSSSSNMFVVVGCETVGIISDYNASQFGTGCVALCIDGTTEIKSPVNLPEEVAPCKGIGCCKTDIPTGVKTLNISLASLLNHTHILSHPSQSACLRECGDIGVPYPFGLFGDSAECFLNTTFRLTCNHSFTPPRLLYAGDTPVLNTSLEEGTMIFEYPVAFTRYNVSGVEHAYATAVSLGEISPFTFSSSSNMFVVVGCETVGIISDYKASQFGTGCVAVCIDGTTVKKSPVNLPPKVAPCKGFGCCETDIPTGLKTLNISLASLFNHTGILEDNPMEYGYVTGTDLHLLKRSDKDGGEYYTSQVVVDWAIGNLTCEQVEQSGGQPPICGANTNCTNSANGPGYRCFCLPGFQLGNPYTEAGCTDIDECSHENRGKYPCKGRCENMPGYYTCHCSFGYGGDGKGGCSLKPVTKVIAGVVFGLLTGIGLSLALAKLVPRLILRYHSLIHQKENLKRKDMLLKHLSVKIFSEAELEKATNNFEARGLLGEGGNGWVYKGSLADNAEIAVKKSKVLDRNKMEQFLNEVDIVSKINHKNVVKLLGVCLDTQVPMLVYEYITNGTLFHHLHGKSPTILYSWPVCLRIAAETASALDYMHSLAHPPIIHRDIKSANILLDAKYTAKVADFGASKLIQLDGAVQSTQGEGTMGYLDPEYVQTGELTTMSDVYGFGVVLMELLSKQKPLSRGASGEMISLVMVFTSAVEENQLDHVLKYRNLDANDIEQAHIVARLAARCVAMPSKDRPTMKEVAYVLDGLGKEHESLKTDGTWDELVSLLDEEQFVTSRVTFELEYHTAVTS